MTLSDLIIYLDRFSGYQILDGSPAETLAKSLSGNHSNTYIGEIISSMAEKLGLDDVDRVMPERVQVINSLGNLRLKYMADDAPVEGFRIVEKVIATIDSAYNEEALDHKGG